jgi:hypothetical protein
MCVKPRDLLSVCICFMCPAADLIEFIQRYYEIYLKCNVELSFNALLLRSLIFWDVILYNLLEVYRRFGGTCFFLLLGRRISQSTKKRVNKQSEQIETVLSSETSVKFYQANGVTSKKVKPREPPIQDALIFLAFFI